MDLVQNIATFEAAVKEETIPLAQAIKILYGLQKVYVRKMSYLYEDSQFVLTSLDAPFRNPSV